MKTNSPHAWVLASRPKTLTGAAAPVLIGGCMAFADSLNSFNSLNSLNSSFHSLLTPFFLCLLFAFLMQIDANFINDYFDFRKGTDREDRLGPERACAQGWITPKAMKIGIAITTVLSVIVGLFMLFLNLQWELIIVGILCVVFCFLYTTCMSYLGLGDVLVLVFFGIVPVTFTYYLMTDGSWTLPLIVASIAMGLATDNLLMVNNYRDRYQDEISGKQTIIVRIIRSQIKSRGPIEGKRIGETLCRKIYLWLGITAFTFAVVALLMIPASNVANRIILCSLYLIPHVRTYKEMSALDGRDLNKVLGATARNIFIFGLLVALSMFL